MQKLFAKKLSKRKNISRLLLCMDKTDSPFFETQSPEKRVCLIHLRSYRYVNFQERQKST